MIEFNEKIGYLIIGALVSSLLVYSIMQRKNSRKGLLDGLKKNYIQIITIYSDMFFSDIYPPEILDIIQDICITANKMNEKIYLHLNDIEDFKYYIQEDLPYINRLLIRYKIEKSEEERQNILFMLKAKNSSCKNFYIKE